MPWLPSKTVSHSWMTGVCLGSVTPTMASVCTQENLTSPSLQYLKLCHWLYYTLTCPSAPYFHPFPVTLPPHISFVHSAGDTLLHPVTLTTPLPLLHTLCLDPSCSCCCRIFCLRCPAPLQSSTSNTVNFITVSFIECVTLRLWRTFKIILLVRCCSACKGPWRCLQNPSSSIY